MGDGPGSVRNHEGDGEVSVFNQTNDGDLVLTNGQLTLKDGPEECAIRVRNRLFTIRGEWFADTSIGIPY